MRDSTFEQIVCDGGNRGNKDAHPKEEPVVATPPSPAGSQTLSRGIRVLEILSDAGGPLTIDETASRLGVHRSNAYRLVRTLEDHGLVGRDPHGGLVLGARLAALAAGVDRDLQAEALPELTTAANELGMTCFVTVLDREECVTLTSVEPRHAVAAVAQRPGTRHFVGVGAPGRAILAQVPQSEWPAEVSGQVAADVHGAGAGVFISYDEVIANLRAVAVPLQIRGHAPAAVGAVYVSSSHSAEEIGVRLSAAAAAIVGALGG